MSLKAKQNSDRLKQWTQTFIFMTEGEENVNASCNIYRILFSGSGLASILLTTSFFWQSDEDFSFCPFFAVVYGQHGRRLTYSDYDVCAVRGSTLNISSTYRLPSEDTIKSFVWFIKSEDSQYQNLADVPQFFGRVSHGCSGQTCTLTIRNLTESDSAEFCFGFTSTNDPRLYRGDPGVTLIVTGEMFSSLSVTSAREPMKYWF